jgi:hypothetical protein
VAHLFASLAPIQRGELTTVVLLTINVFVLLTCYYVLKVVREPLILLGGGAELKATNGTTPDSRMRWHREAWPTAPNPRVRARWSRRWFGCSVADRLSALSHRLTHSRRPAYAQIRTNPGFLVAIARAPPRRSS